MPDLGLVDAGEVPDEAELGGGGAPEQHRRAVSQEGVLAPLQGNSHRKYTTNEPPTKKYTSCFESFLLLAFIKQYSQFCIKAFVHTGGEQTWRLRKYSMPSVLWRVKDTVRPSFLPRGFSL